MGIIALTYNGGLTSMNLHDLFTFEILLDRNIRVQYITKYIVQKNPEINTPTNATVSILNKAV